MTFDARRWAILAATIVIGAAGGTLASLTGLPAAWLSGSMVAVTVASLAGLDTRLPLRLVDVVFLVIGMSLGAGVSPEMVSGLASWPVSLAGLALTVIACTYAVRAFLMRVAGWDRDTAFFSSVPGALSYVLAIASDTRADIRKVAASQSVRVFLLVAVLPSLIIAVEPGKPVMIVRPEASAWELAVIVVTAAATGIGFRLMHVPAPMLTGALAASAVLHGTGLIAGTLPAPAVTVAFVLLGALIGSRFSGTTLAFLGRIGVASVGGFVIATAIASLMALAIAWLTGVSADQAIVAYAPGGLDAMTTLALALNMDSAFVAAHQLARFVGIALALPFLARKALARGREARKG